MATTQPFDVYTDRYDQWFDEHPHAYRSEMKALDTVTPDDAEGLAVGVGTGRFAAPFDVETGVDPSRAMLEVAADRGIYGVRGVAEALPFHAAAFDVVLNVTTICFVDDVRKTLEETRRVLRDDGRAVLGFVDRDGPLGNRYEEKKEENPFYRDATFVSAEELVRELEDAEFDVVESVQTLFSLPNELADVDRVERGRGQGSFVALAAEPR